MKKEEVLQLMSAIPPDLIEEADIKAPARRRLPKLARAGLIAACLCLALLGTAFAANPEAMAALIERLNVQITTDRGRDIYTVGGKLTAFPLSDFSPALNEDSESRGIRVVVQKKFNTWDEVQAYLGEDIPSIWPGDGKDWEKPGRRYNVDLLHTQLEQLWGIQVYSTNLDLQAEVSFHLYTEHCPSLNENMSPLGGMYGSMGSVEQLEDYSMANGLTAEILVDTEDASLIIGDGQPLCSAIGYFARSGILYRVEAFGAAPTRDETVSRLYTILDSFP